MTLFNNTLFGGREEQAIGANGSAVLATASPQAQLPTAFPRPTNNPTDSPRILSSFDASNRPSSALSRTTSSAGRAPQMTLSQQLRLQRLTVCPGCCCLLRAFPVIQSFRHCVCARYQRTWRSSSQLYHGLEVAALPSDRKICSRMVGTRLLPEMH